MENDTAAAPAAAAMDHRKLRFLAASANVEMITAICEASIP
jgi:hypothetical protein